MLKIKTDKSIPCIALVLVAILMVILVGVIVNRYVKKHQNESVPIIQTAVSVTKEHEPFKKEVVLINLHDLASGHFMPGADFSLQALKARHLDERSNSYDYPWSMDFLPGGNILIAIHHGSLLIYEADKKQLSRISNMPEDIAVDSYQMGLLDLVVDPEFSKNYKIYFSYTAERKNKKNEIKYTTCFIKSNLENNRLEDTKRFCVPSWNDAKTQFGGALALDNSDNILLSVGDRTRRNAAQDINSYLGKILRLDKYSLMPSFGNPFAENKLVWSMGHRNPQGLFYDSQHDTLYETEHGPLGGDEVNIIRRGLNYGWPVISYGREYESGNAIGEGSAKTGLAQPLYYYVPSIATSAIMMYRGNMFPEWRGSLFIASLAGYHINHLTLHNNKVIAEERFLGYMQSRIRDIKEADDGSIYVLFEDGFILRLFR